MRKKALAALAVLGLMAALVGSAGAGQQEKQQPRFPRGDDYERLQARLELMFKRHEDRAKAWRAGHPDDAQHGFPAEHLEGSRKNMKVLKRVRLTDTEGGVADVNAHRGYAYVAKWSRTCRLNGGTGAGVSVVDVKPAGQAREVAFIRSAHNAYQTEGVHALRVKTPKFEGDLLMVSHEPCAGEFPLGGGFSLYDVTNPARPKILVEQFGDFDLAEATGGTPNAIHSAFVWNDRKKGKAYVIASDNYEFNDIDIFDITDPRNPEQIADVDPFDEMPAEWLDNVAIGDLYYNHDQWVKKINGKWYGVSSYWDLGNLILDLDDPANPKFIGKTMWDEVDPSGFVPEGDAHQATWNKNGRWLFTTDEDWAPYRTFFSITSGDGEGDYPADQFGWTPQIATLPGKEAVGSVVYGGLGCPSNEEYGEQPAVPDADDFDAAEGELKILVLQRGVCFFSEKVESAQDAGWDLVIVANHHAGSADGALPDAHLCGSQGHAFTPTIQGVCIGHRAFHLLFDQEPTYEGDDEPAIGTVGHSVKALSEFEGWSYIRQFDFKDPANPMQVDTYAVEESTKEEFAHIFALSPHETKTDPRKGKRLVYSSYYQAGARVLKFSGQGMKEVGHFVANRGNDFWGVYPVKRGDKRPILVFSDRDFGLFLLRYTGRQ